MMKKLVVVLFLALIVGSASAQVQIQKVEASFIANFMRYIKWPEQESMKTFTIGVYGKNHAMFKELTSSINGRNVGVATINVIEVESVEAAKGCQMLFIPNGKSARAKKMVEELAASAVMPITEEQDFMPKFAMINFKVKNSKLTFQLNPELAKAKQIQVSSKLAQMASN
ncbi:YfiR family protein [Labilibacter marinus]|uniref:YfiR family protein n=1 Tax=Labilibacter marinus TaxID=1477105 RepID=UPI00095007E5|nr:YfiR family protein [Labilibacter marinus]